jgi:hypothetical protein
MEKPPSPAAALEAARLAGFDLSLVESNLALSPEARLLRHDAALELALELRAIGNLHYAKPQPATPATS